MHYKGGEPTLTLSEILEEFSAYHLTIQVNNIPRAEEGISTNQLGGTLILLVPYTGNTIHQFPQNITWESWGLGENDRLRIRCMP